MCRILTDKKVDSDDKFAAFVTLGDVLFPDEDVFRHAQIGWLLSSLCDNCDLESTVIDILEVALRLRLFPSERIAKLAAKFGVSLAGAEAAESLEARDKALEEWENEGIEQHFITDGVPELPRAEDVSVCLPPGFDQCHLSVVRDGNCEMYPISEGVAAELIAVGLGYQG
jgi:hypothetical protein